VGGEGREGGVVSRFTHTFFTLPATAAAAASTFSLLSFTPTSLFCRNTAKAASAAAFPSCFDVVKEVVVKGEEETL